ncbi:homeobox-leucine zipper protein HOX11-like [Triticum dicoccoides]|uniref:homeobox-leucine zipper protein HOX11-like n=1 Tax=Triticum dicoccoides TaxID=85692 RepID=UPI00188F74B8|nr:homeobox-leucine zipper protein HOX11-like [Triticum dicoccoides]
MELGLSLGEAMADAGRELVLGLGVGVGVGPGAAREGEGRRDHDVGAAARGGLALGCGSSPEPAMRLALLPMVPSLGFPWPSESRHLEASTRGFDVNQAPSSGGSAWGACAAAEEEQEDTAAAARAAVSSSPNDSGGSFPMDFSARGASDAAPGAGGSRGSDEDDGRSARKKLRLSKEQAAFLEESFKEHSTLNPRQKVALAKQLNLRPRQVEVWFQNRRARTKLKQTEVDCEYLKRCCETLTEENRRLQKELAELRALKTVHPFYMHLPATTLSMCPSCERVASNSAPASAAAPSPAAPAPASGAGIASPAAAPEQHRPSSFAALFSSARSFPLAAPQPQPPLPAPSSS